MTSFFLPSFLALVGGILLGEGVVLGPLSPWLFPLVLGMVFSILFFPPVRQRLFAIYLFFLLTLTAFCFSQNLRGPPFPTTKGVLKGQLVSTPFLSRTRKGQTFFLRGVFRSAFQKKKGLFRVTLPFPHPLSPGTLVVLRGSLSPIPLPSNPNQRPWGRRLCRRGVVGLFKTAKDGFVDWRENITAGALLNWIRRQSLHGLDSVGGEQSKVIKALLLGERDSREGLWGEFKKTGATHFFAISGLHLGILFFSLWSLARALALSWRKALLLAFLGITLYLPLTGARPPVIRAYVMIGTFLVGEIFLLPSNPWNSLGLAGCILSLLHPWEVFEVGFVLSFVAVGGILFFYPKLRKKTDLWTKKWPWFFRGWFKLLLVSLSAWIVTAPLIAYSFSFFSPLGILASLVLFPLIFLALSVGFFALLFYWIWPPLFYFFLPALKGILFLLIGSNRFLLQTGFFCYVLPPDRLNILIYYSFLMALIYRRKIPLSLICTTLGISVFSHLLSLATPSSGKVVFLDVGHGLSVVVQTPGKKWIVYDGGSYWEQDIGRTIILPYLRGEKAPRIDLLIISHAHKDHLSGLASLVEQYPIQRVWIPPNFCKSFLGRKLVALLKKKAIPFRVVSAGTLLSWGHGEITSVLAPPLITLSGYKINTNNGSLVVRIAWKNHSILLTGDMEGWESAWLIQNKNIASQIYLIPHHGGKNPLHSELSRAISPLLVLHSNNQPLSAPLQSIYSQKKSQILSTSRWGAIEILGKKTGWTWKGFCKKNGF